jgi:uncharacterized protein YxjI
VSELLERDRLVFNQKAKLIELNAEFAIRDTDGNQIGAIKQEGQSRAKKLVRALTKLDQFMTHTLSVYDAGGAKVVELTRPAKILKSTVVVRDGSGAEAGRIVQKNAIGKIRFSLKTRGATRSARSTPRTGERGTSTSRTRTRPRSRASRRPGRGWRRPCSPPPMITSSR